MAFTFQINQDVAFRHDDELLAKAKACCPTIYTNKVLPKATVNLIDDATKLNHVGVKDINQSIENLKDYGMKRDDILILDFKEHCVGKFQVDIQSIGSPMDAPLYIRIRFGEIAAELAQESSSYDGWLSKSWIQEEYIHIDELPSTLCLPRRYSFRFVEIKVLDTSPKWQVTFSNPFVICETSANYEQHHPFILEDFELQKIYDVSVKTLAQCMQDVFEDGPKRDRRLWLGDLRLQALANYATFHNADLVKRCLYLFAAMPTVEGKIVANVFVKPKNTPDDTFLFDYSLFFISTLFDYNNEYHDASFLKELYPIAKTQMDIALQQVNKDGKLQLNDAYPVFVDWSNAFDKDSAGQGILIYVLKQFIQLAQIQKEKDLAMYERVLEDMVCYAKVTLFDTDKQLFVSGKAREVNIASQVWMVLANVFDVKESQAVMKQCVQTLFPIKGIATPYMYHHVVEALFVADLQEEAIQLMKAYWGKMIDLGADTYWEAFDPNEPNYSPYGNPIISSYCHAWSCTPAYLLKKYLKK